MGKTHDKFKKQVEVYLQGMQFYQNPCILIMQKEVPSLIMCIKQRTEICFHIIKTLAQIDTETKLKLAMKSKWKCVLRDWMPHENQTP